MTVPFAGRAFGLDFLCERDLPELANSPGPTRPAPPVLVEWVAQSTRDEQSECGGGLAKVTADGLDLKIPGIATYQISAAKIRVLAEPECDEASVRAFLFGSAIGALLHLRGVPVLHASAVRLADGSAAMFCGHTTAGKSTLAMALVQRGHAMLADDTAALDIDTRGLAHCLPGLSRVKLWRTALDALTLSDLALSSARVRPNIDKYSLGFAQADRPAPLRWVYELRAVEQGELRFSEVRGVEKITVLMSHTFRPGFLHALGRQPEHLRCVAALASNLRMARIDRPREEQTLDAICDRLERQWRE